MEKTKTLLLKRIKRHVIGPTHDFFAVTAPGLETICRDEIAALPLTNPRPEVVWGGVKFSGRLTDCYRANLCLATATRILMRIDHFKATRFDTLEKKAADFPWELYLLPGTPIRCHVTTRRSRLYHTDAVAQRIQAGIAARLSEFVQPSGTDNHTVPQTLFVRGEKDRFTLSLDSSGDALYKRGLKTHGGRAPLRETVASALLMQMGYTGHEVLLDPMCGAGTFALEATFKVLNVPPGWFRDFAFKGWPSFRPSTWAHMLRRYEARLTHPETPRVYASDSDKTVCGLLRHTIDNKGFGGIITVSDRDFFKFSPDRITNQTGCVALNPPYGLRLGRPADTAEFLEKVYAKLQTDYQGWRFGLVLPSSAAMRKPPFPYNSIKVLHGGLRLKLCTGVIRN